MSKPRRIPLPADVVAAQKLCMQLVQEYAQLERETENPIIKAIARAMNELAYSKWRQLGREARNGQPVTTPATGTIIIPLDSPTRRELGIRAWLVAQPQGKKTCFTAYVQAPDSLPEFAGTAHTRPEAEAKADQVVLQLIGKIEGYQVAATA